MSNLYIDVFVNGLLGEIAKVHNAKAISATIIMVYIAIDAMAYLSMPSDKTQNNSSDFKNWIEKYMKTDINQSYHYTADEMWGARCAMLHSYSSYSHYSENKKCKLYGYHDGSDHIYNPIESKELVMISCPRLVKDFRDALILFINDIAKNPELKEITDMRIERISQQFPFKK